MPPDPPFTRPRSNAVSFPSAKSRGPEFTTAPKAWTREDIARASLEREDYEEFAWSIIEGISEALEDKKVFSDVITSIIKLGVSSTKTVHGMGSTAYSTKNVSEDLLKNLLKEGLVYNPHLRIMGYDIARLSPKTHKYMIDRGLKKVGSAVWTWGGALASNAIEVDVGTASLGVQSLALTGMHAIKLKQLRDRYDNEEFRGYIDICLTAKAVKAASRGIDTTMALIPGASLAAKLSTTAVNAIGKVAAKVTLGKAIDRASQLVHMHAYLEQEDQGPKPATELMQEIFKRRGVLGGFGHLNQYDVKTIISEPAGWMALSDKLKLI